MRQRWLKWFQKLEDEDGLYPTLIPNERYLDKERKHLLEFIPDVKLINKVQSFAIEKAQAETDRNTYQAMEAFIHNLNTMHSRAGAQVPFSSINYGTDISPRAGWLSKTFFWPLKQVLAMEKPPYSCTNI